MNEIRGQMGSHRFGSRQKGARVERIIVDWMRQLGYTAYRVPLSGASMGDKGDIKVEIPATRYGNRPMDAQFLYGEAKARRNSFDAIYALFDKLRGTELTVSLDIDGTLVTLSYDFNALGLINNSGQHYFKIVEVQGKEKSTLKKIAKLKELLKGSDFLILKGDRKKLIFLRYF